MENGLGLRVDEGQQEQETQRLNEGDDSPRDTREAWLHRAVELLKPKFQALKATLPANLHLSVGLPKGRKAIGECWAGAQSEDGGRHIFISPVLGAYQALDTLVHELAHAALDHEAGHKAPFKRLGLALGLEGKPKHMSAGPALQAELEQMLVELGDYPHAKLDPSKVGKKQGTRLVKAECPTCGYTVRTTAKWLDYAGEPLCPADACEKVRMVSDYVPGDDAEDEGDE